MKRSEMLLETVRDLPCLCCGESPCDAHHVTTRGAGGQDTPENLMPLCREHHTLWHAKGPKYMILTFPAVQFWLEGAERWEILHKAGFSKELC
jgi:hypothetical protein